MVARRPLVINDGFYDELPQGDTVRTGVEVLAGSGIISNGEGRVDIGLPPNPSGLIFTNEALGIDGAALVTAQGALVSGAFAGEVANSALASGNNALAVGTEALASGNAAFIAISGLGTQGGLTTGLPTGSPVASGQPVGFNEGLAVEPIRVESSQSLTYNNTPVIYASTPVNQPVGVACDTATDGTDIAFVSAYAFLGSSSPLLYTIDRTPPNTPVLQAVTIAGANDRVYDAVSVSSTLFAVWTDTLSQTRGNLVSAATTNLFSWGNWIINSNTSVNPKVTYNSFRSLYFVSSWDTANNFYQLVVCSVPNVTGPITPGSWIQGQSSADQYHDTCQIPGTPYVVMFYKAPTTRYGTWSLYEVTSSLTANLLNSSTFILDTIYAPKVVYDEEANKVIFACINSSQVLRFYTFELVTSTIPTLSYKSDATYSGGSPYLQGDSTFALSYSPIDKVCLFSVYSGNTPDQPRFQVLEVSSTGSISLGPFVAGPSSLTNTYTSLVYNTTAKAWSFITTETSNDYPVVVLFNPFTINTCLPTLNGDNNYIGISNSTVPSGSLCKVDLPGSLYEYPAADLTAGDFYYLDPATSGVTNVTTQPSYWNGAVSWDYIGRAVTPSGLMLLNSI